MGESHGEPSSGPDGDPSGTVELRRLSDAAAAMAALSESDFGSTTASKPKKDRSSAPTTSSSSSTPSSTVARLFSKPANDNTTNSNSGMVETNSTQFRPSDSYAGGAGERGLVSVPSGASGGEEIKTVTQAERDFIDSDPAYGAGFVRDDEDSSSYDSPGYESDEYSDPYQELEDAGCCSRFCFDVQNRLMSFRWRIRNAARSSTRPGRLLDRDNAFHQSSGRLHISQVATGRTAAEILALYSDDWFHVMLSLATWQLLLIMILIYTTNLLVFAGFYMVVDRPEQSCGLTAEAAQAVSFQTAFAFSLITSSTIGYGFPSSSDPFFHDCVSLVVVVYFQIIVSMAINALVVGLVLQRLGRADSRSHQVVFSDKACIRCIHGHFYFMFQVYDLDRRHPVVEAHVRLYAVFHETDGDDIVHYQTRYMRLQNPNDDLGGVLFLSVPCTVVHCIDQWSPLMPPSLSRFTWENENDDFVHNASNRYIFPGLILREADTETGNRDGTSCPICGETFPTDQHLLRHIRYQQWEERANGLQPVLDRDIMNKLFPPIENEDDLEQYEVADEDSLLNKGMNGDTPISLHVNGESPSTSLSPNQSLADAPRPLSAVEEHPVGGTGNGNSDSKSIAHKTSESKMRASSSRRLSKMERKRMVHHGKRMRISRILRFYANLDLPIGHQDVDMNLLQTEYELVPDRDDATSKAPNDTDIFAMFEEMEKERTSKASKHSVLEEDEGPSQSPSEQGFRLRRHRSSRRFNRSGTSTLDDTPPITPLGDRKFRQKTKSVEAFRKSIEDHVNSSGIEVIVLVEGIEARSSNTFQARHSYTFDNIEFNKFFTPCMKVSPYGHAQVNLNSFHQTIPVPSHVDEIIGMSHT